MAINLEGYISFYHIYWGNHAHTHQPPNGFKQTYQGQTKTQCNLQSAMCGRPEKQPTHAPFLMIRAELCPTICRFPLRWGTFIQQTSTIGITHQLTIPAARCWQAKGRGTAFVG